MNLCVCSFAVIVPLIQAYEYETLWFETKLDHFSFSGNETFKMRVLFNDSYFDEGKPGPVFIYIGNEGNIELFAENTGLMWDWAPDFGALLIFAEHRFYGETLPFGEKSFESVEQYRYLTVEQAMADFADLVGHIKKKWPVKKVVAFGGSYGGMLATWMRIKYPWLIDAALASSAPILQFQDVTPCEAYEKTLTKAFATGGEKCVENIRKSWTALKTLAEAGGSGASSMQEKFRLCENDLSSNFTAVRDWIHDTYSELAAANHPYSTDYIGKVPAYPVKVACSFLDKDFENDEDLLSGVFEAISVFRNFSGTTQCNNISGPDGSPEDLGWTIQECTDMVLPFCANGVEDMFYPYPWNFTEHRETCEKEYGLTPRLYFAVQAFGGRNINSSSNIIFSNGELDAWSGGGLLEQLNPSLPVVIIEGAGHHYDLRPANPMDTSAVIDARNVEKEYIKSWIA